MFRPGASSWSVGSTSPVEQMEAGILRGELRRRFREKELSALSLCTLSRQLMPSRLSVGHEKATNSTWVSRPNCEFVLSAFLVDLFDLSCVQFVKKLRLLRLFHHYLYHL